MSDEIVTIKRDALRKLVEAAMKYGMLLRWGIRDEYSHFYDALSEAFAEPVDDYEDYSQFADVVIDKIIKGEEFSCQ